MRHLHKSKLILLLRRSIRLLLLLLYIRNYLISLIIWSSIESFEIVLNLSKSSLSHALIFFMSSYDSIVLLLRAFLASYFSTRSLFRLSYFLYLFLIWSLVLWGKRAASTEKSVPKYSKPLKKSLVSSNFHFFVCSRFTKDDDVIL